MVIRPYGVIEMGYDSAKHHRQSIRLEQHDYAGGGIYFVTLCTHREAGQIFASEAAKRIAEECWAAIPEHFPHAKGGAFVAMPDHVHGIIHMHHANVGAKNLSPSLPHGRPRGTSRTLGSVIRGFKIGVGKGLRTECSVDVEHIWQRNYYEMIVRTPEAAKNIERYIRMNPWCCVQELGGGLRGIGNPALWNRKKLGVLCSRNAPRIGRLPDADVYFSGWHSPKEKEILDWLLKHGKRVIACPAWGLDGFVRAEANGANRANGANDYSPVLLDALEGNRMLILEMRNLDGDLAAAEQRNRFVLEKADSLWLPHVSRGGMLDRLIGDMQADKKIIHAGRAHE